MTPRNVIMWTLLPVLVVLIVSSGVPAQGLTEVPASKILEQIENGEDVYIEDARITGELNLSKIEVETVPIARPELELEIFGLEEELKIVESEIAITNSVFENDVDFSNTLFNNTLNFYNTTFSGKADFRGASFSDATGFWDANFSGGADFWNARFSGYASFRNASFSGNTYFNGANFSGNAFFRNASFSGNSSFSNARFNLRIPCGLPQGYLMY